MLNIVREISKLCMFTVLWAFPIILAKWNGNNNFLWFLILSLIGTVGVFSHYEDLEKIDNNEQENSESNE